MELKDGKDFEEEDEGEGDWKFQRIELPEPQRTNTTLKGLLRNTTRSPHYGLNVSAANTQPP